MWTSSSRPTSSTSAASTQGKQPSPRAAEVVVERSDDATLLPIVTDVDVTIEYEGTLYAFTEADPEWTGTGFHITNINGAPVIPGSYNITATGLGYSLETRSDVGVPQDYPSDLVHEEAFYLQQSTNAFLVVRVVDATGAPIPGATVTITPELEAPFTLITDADGD